MSAPDPSTPAIELAAALRRRELSAVELLDACLEAVDARNGDVNAIVWRDDAAARASARHADEALARGDDRAFLGVPIPIKDLTPVAGWPVTYGSRGGPSGVSAEGELTTEAFKRAGFVLCGRTNTPEFGHITATENLRYGISRNPWDLERTPGGSSGGAAAATAAGVFPPAPAHDGGGPIPLPPSRCGLLRLKPARARVPRANTSWLGAVVEGVVTRTVSDTAAVLDAIAGPDPYSWNNAPAPARPFSDEVGADGPRLRVGVMDHGPNGMPIDPETAESARKLARTLEEQGHSVEPVEVQVLSEELIEPFIVWVAASLGEEEGIDWAKVEPHIAAQWQQASEFPAASYVAAHKALELRSRELTAGFKRDYDVLVTPTLAIQPPPAGAIMEATHAAPDAPSEAVIGMVAFNAWVNITGLPSIQLPVHEAGGVPIGAQIVGSPFDESSLLRLAAEVEQANPWADRRATLATA